MKGAIMYSDPHALPLAPNFYNIRRGICIDWLLSVKIDPFQTFKNPKSGEAEDYYLHVMREMPKLAEETDWELAAIHKHSNNLTARIAAARARR